MYTVINNLNQSKLEQVLNENVGKLISIHHVSNGEFTVVFFSPIEVLQG